MFICFHARETKNCWNTFFYQKSKTTTTPLPPPRLKQTLSLLGLKYKTKWLMNYSLTSVLMFYLFSYQQFIYWHHLAFIQILSYRYPSVLLASQFLLSNNKSTVYLKTQKNVLFGFFKLCLWLAFLDTVQKLHTILFTLLNSSSS